MTTDKYGDGCPATQAYLNNPQEALGFDTRGNFYVADRGNNLVRSFSYNNQFPATAVGSSVTQPLAFLYAAGSLPVTESFTAQGSTTSDYSDGGGDTCALNITQTATTTCVDYVKFAPLAAGQRPGSVTVSSATATIGTQSLSGVGSSAALSIDPGTSAALGTSLQPLSVSTDTVGNVNISDGKSKQVLRATIASGATTPLITGLGTPRQTTTDSYGDVFVADSTANDVVEHTVAGATVTLGTGLSAPQGVAADVLGNVYVADTGNNRLVYISPVTGDQAVLPVSGFTLSAPTYLALDAAGDLYIIDSANTRLLELPLQGTPQTITLPSGTVPVAIAFDPAGDIYIADKTTGAVCAASRLYDCDPVGHSTHNSGGSSCGPTGNLFVADSGAASVAAYNRSLNTSVFATTNINLISLPITLTVGSIGNVTATLSTPPYTETGTAAAFASTGTPTCTAGATLAPGANLHADVRLQAHDTGRAKRTGGFLDHDRSNRYRKIQRHGHESDFDHNHSHAERKRHGQLWPDCYLHGDAHACIERQLGAYGYVVFPCGWQHYIYADGEYGADTFTANLSVGRTRLR